MPADRHCHVFRRFVRHAKANSGMLDMKGYKDPSLKGAFTLGGEGQEKEASILGQTVTAKDLEEKQKQLEQAETFNLFSKPEKPFQIP